MLPNHPSRHNDGDDEPDYGEVTIETLRRLNDAAPDVVFGMEGMPGNQMDPACELPASDIRAGADEMISVTGGVWDCLLYTSKIRRIWELSYGEYKASGHIQSHVQQKASHAIMDCKSGRLGANLSQCPDCEHLELSLIHI